MNHSWEQSRTPFLWGAATSSHQVEGDNQLNDWWHAEKAGKVPFESGKASNQFQTFREDIQLIKQLGHTAHRFSLEWSRIEPREGEWDFSALEHYREFICELKERGIEPIVTLHHFTNPQWFMEAGGWAEPSAEERFVNYVKFVVGHFAEDVRFWITINEPIVYLYHSYFVGIWPPNHSDFNESMNVFRHLLRAHIRVYGMIHAHYDSRGLSKPAVSFAKHMIHLEPCHADNAKDRFSVWLRYWFLNDLFLQASVSGFLFFPGVFCEMLPGHSTLDFIAINYYTRHHIRFGGWSVIGALGEECSSEDCEHSKCERNQLGWEVFPEGLGAILKKVRRFNLPVMITENGVCTEDDQQRVDYIQRHVDELQKARCLGLDVLGYLHWSLLDNFEWAEGFDPRFGIVGVNYDNFQRNIKNSAYALRDSCRQLIYAESNQPTRVI